MAETPLLSVAGAVSGYGEGVVLEGLSLSVAPGEAVALIGRNGAGKTTLLKTIMGLLRLRSGEIRFLGRRIDGLAPFAIARRGIGYVPQGREVFADLTVEENLVLGDLKAMDARQAYAIFPALARRRDEPAGRLSGGQQQQLVIARALMGQPQLLLLDEPSEGIQPSIVEEIAAILSQIGTRRGMALILVEQNIPMALSVASRVVFIDQGRATTSWSSARLRAEPDLVERHLAI
jgi:ABC-type branched-subunit amino acid transport system ATPase component